VPSPPGLFRKMHLPVLTVLYLQITAPLASVANVAQTRQHARHDTIVAAATAVRLMVSTAFFLTKGLRHTSCLTSRPPRVTETWICEC
jgi:hypothetical protein